MPICVRGFGIDFRSTNRQPYLMHLPTRSTLTILILLLFVSSAGAQTYSNAAVQRMYGALMILERRINIELNRPQFKHPTATGDEKIRQKLAELGQLKTEISTARGAAQTLMSAQGGSSHSEGVDDNDPHLKTLLNSMTQIQDHRYFTQNLDSHARRQFNQSAQRFHESTGPSAPDFEPAGTNSALMGAESCPDLSLDAPDHSAHGLPVKNQKSEGICYGIVAAELIDSYRQTYAPTSPFRPVSPLILSIETELANQQSRRSNVPDHIKNLNFTEKAKELSELKRQHEELGKEIGQRHPETGDAIQKYELQSLKFKMQLLESKMRIIEIQTEWARNHENFEKNPNYLDKGATAMDALLIAKNGGACLENPKDESAATMEFYLNFSDFIKLGHRVILHGQHSRMTPTERAQQVAGRVVCHLESRGISVTAEKLAVDIEALAGKEADDFLEGLLTAITKECNQGNRLSPSSIPDPVTLEIKSQAELDNLVHERFGSGSQKKLPFALSICSDILGAGPQHRGLNESNRCGSGDGHAVTVIGSRWNPNTRQCFLKVKNSWGTSCNSISSAWNCKAGILSIDTQTLARNAYQATYLPPRQ
jgi:hypothetical protein